MVLNSGAFHSGPLVRAEHQDLPAIFHAISVSQNVRVQKKLFPCGLVKASRSPSLSAAHDCNSTPTVSIQAMLAVNP